ncbi:hypothetical protein [Pseudomonas sivasensis]|uniref:hypothetical protein n=1 Tax=Pseudomonas sivasensis TaxID=1880678 RepID=UPI0015C4DCD2|nr:hypothetical protein [Pseudomonas sivasensis]
MKLDHHIFRKLSLEEMFAEQIAELQAECDRMNTLALSRQHIRFQDDKIVQLAIRELGADDVLRISRNHYMKIYGVRYPQIVDTTPNLDDQQRRDQYLSTLKSLLGKAYLRDTSKIQLRQYLEHKFGADLGL